MSSEISAIVQHVFNFYKYLIKHAEQDQDLYEQIYILYNNSVILLCDPAFYQSNINQSYVQLYKSLKHENQDLYNLFTITLITDNKSF